ncbi:MAG: cysteine desulfurase NifS [Lachnospiraceae bacterium]|nr:cysteine desulfurase NifS [Lachnospiraceae bacterium]
MAGKPLIYMDHAATTATRPEVVEAMLPYFTNEFGNPSSVYSISQKNRAKVTQCREAIAKTLNAEANEIYFTAGGSEADNWAIKAVCDAYYSDNNIHDIEENISDVKNKYRTGRHIITTRIEHHAVLHTCEYLERMGFDVTYIDVDENGIVKLDVLRKAIRPDTILISVMFANNEIGTVEPIKEIGELAHENNIIFHTDAVQAYGQIPIDVDEYHIDLLSASGHKLNGPKGIGFLYIRNNLKIGSFIHGGAQERGRRAGTENVPGIVGLSKACEMAFDTMKERGRKEIMMRDHLIDRILSEVPYARLNGHRTKRLPNNVNISFQFVEGESMLIMLDMAGICASAGSACTSGSTSPSHVLTALGLPEDIAHGSLRMTLGDENTMEEIDYVVEKIKEYVGRLRAMSPQYEDFVGRR